MTYIERDIAITVKKALQQMPVVVITGMRQTGKSTFLLNQQELKGRKYFTFDELSHLEAAKMNPDGFVDTEEPMTIDEVQKCPEVLISIKKVVDRKRKPGMFLLSGSANFSLLKNVSESLAGRAVYFVMHPMSLRELGGRVSEEPFLLRFFKALEIPKLERLSFIDDEQILKGGLPPVALNLVEDKWLWFKGYEQTYLERDIRQFSQISNVISFRNLLHLISLRTGQILNLSELARDAKLNVSTTDRYLSLIEASFIINRFHPYLKNRASRVIKSTKFYMSDSGLASYLSGIKNFENEPLKGAMFETFVAQNILSIVHSRWTEAEVYFWNVQGRYEVDFVIEAERKCIAIEIKSSTYWTEKDFSGLKSFVDKTENCIAGILAYNGSEAMRISEKLWTLPVSLILS